MRAKAGTGQRLRGVPMISELHLQTKMVAAVREMGGFAQKVSNRFLVGVPDLLFQIPGCHTSYWEVKYSPTLFRRMEPTPKQKIWLRDFTKAGGFCGVVYFAMGKSDLMFAIRPTGFFPYEGDLRLWWKIEHADFTAIPRGSKFAPFKEALQRIHNER